MYVFPESGLLLTNGITAITSAGAGNAGDAGEVLPGAAALVPELIAKMDAAAITARPAAAASHFRLRRSAITHAPESTSADPLGISAASSQSTTSWAV